MAKKVLFDEYGLITRVGQKELRKRLSIAKREINKIRALLYPYVSEKSWYHDELRYIAEHYGVSWKRIKEAK